MMFLVIAKDGAGPTWWEPLGLKPSRVATHWSDGRPMDPPRIQVELTDEDAARFRLATSIKVVQAQPPLTREQIAGQINAFYGEGTPEGERVGDAFLDLMAHLDGLNKKET
jgi:hypothetical protein